MRPIVRSKNEAMEWFLRNSGGTVECRDVALDRFKIVDNYPDAAAFFDACEATRSVTKS